MKETRRKSVRLLSLILAMLMLVSVVPAVSAEEPADNSGVVVNKTATLEKDGTYTIDLSGFVTGETTTTHYNTQVPLDVILVLDSSSSMLQYKQTAETYHVAKATGWPGALESYPAGTTSTTNLWDAFTHANAIYSDNKGAFITNNATLGSILIPVMPGDKIYCSSFKVGVGAKDGIRVTYYKADGSLLSTMDPAEVNQEFTDNNEKYIVVPEGAASMNVGLWDADTEKVIKNLTLDTTHYNPSSDGQMSTMFVAMLQEQVEKFAQTLATNAQTSGQIHNLAIVTFGGGNEGQADQNNQQGYYDKHVSVNGYNNYFFTNTGLFVNGQFKNYLDAEKATGSSYYSYTPIFAADLKEAEGQTYYYLTSCKPSDDGVGDGDGNRTGDFNPVTFKNGKWTATEDGKTLTLTPRVSPYDSDSNTLFLTRKLVAANQLTDEDYKNALTNVNNGGQISENIRFATDRIVARGGTDTKFGLDMAANILAQNPARTYTDAAGNEHKSQQIVILFTDGETDNKETVNGANTYKTIFSHANAIKNAGATIYMISVGTDNDKKWMDQVSSNCGTGSYNDSKEKTGGKYYTNIAGMEDLESIFESITGDFTTSDTSVKLDKTAVMQDVLGEGFVLPEGFGYQNISVSTVAITTTNGTTYTDGAETKYTYDATSGTYKNGSESLTVAFDKATGKVTVTGFDYAANHVTTAKAGKKLVVKITGIEATKNAVTDELIGTNKGNSGIAYTTSNGTSGLYAFPVPQTKLTSKTYVVDYAKPMTIDTSDWSSSFAGMVNGDRLNISAVEGEIDTGYGKFKNNGNNTLTFTPMTTMWDQAATIYAFGKWNKTSESYSNEITTGDNLWTKVNVVPANSVYYEDDFITSEADGTLGIEYTGGYSYVDSNDTNAEGTTTSPESGTTADSVSDSGNNAVHGWEDALAGDNTFSDGSAVRMKKSAKATFTFTGTGVDVYSYTDVKSGIITVKLTRLNTTETYKKILMVDNLAESGEFYQIPTCFFNNLEYGTYKVEIVVGSADKGARETYYLDGIRVYQPMKPSDADGYYAEEEREACFTTIREILLNQNSFSTDADTIGAVYIDSTDGDNNGGEAGQTDLRIEDYEKNGPKNEVYLAKDQSIAFKVDTTKTDAHYYIGLKSITGNPTTAKTFRSGSDDATEIVITHTTDMYYEVIPNSNGYIVITNTTDNELAVTKLRTTCVDGNSNIVQITSVDEPVAQVLMLRSAPVISDEPEVLPEEAIPEETVPEETVPEESKPDIDVDIEDSTPEEPEEDPAAHLKSVLTMLLKGLRGLLKKLRP